MADTVRERGMPVPTGEFPFTWDDFVRIAAIVHGEAGIVLVESKANLVYSRLAKRLRAIGIRSFHDYCELVDSDEGLGERQALIAAMTTNVTRFFREPHHFEHLTDVAMPVLADTARRGGKVRIWSAGCSSGEEPYSIALTVLKAMPDAADHDVLILASDIDPDMIARAEAGAYPSARLADIPPQMRGNAVETARSGGELQFRLTEKVHKLVRFRQLNLLREWPMRGKFNIIFCRNVMIYFDQQTQDSIWSRFARQLSPGGYLYIGHSERVATESLPYELAGQTTYRLKGNHR